MKKGTYIGVKDGKGKKIHVGDVVYRAWSWDFTKEEGHVTYYQFHKLTWNKKDKRVLLGSCYNSWKGKEIRRVSKKEFVASDIPLETDFRIEEGKPVLRIW